MASNVFVVDSSFRRTQIKVQPNTYLRTVLEEACAKLKLDPDQYTLKTDKQKQLDLSLTYRLSGLSPGAKLHLTQASRSPSVVNVALALPASENGARLHDKFPSNTSLWLVLRKFEEGVAGGDQSQKLNLTSRGVPSTDSGSGRLIYEQPCVNIMGRELSSFTDLQKTLAQLGYNSGSVLLRLTFKQDGTPMEEAMAMISNYFQSVQPAAPEATTEKPETSSARGAHANTDVEMSSVPDASAGNTAALSEEQAGPEPSEDAVMTPAPAADETPVPAEGADVVASSSTTAVPSTESQFPSLKQESSAPASSAAQPKPKFSVYSAPTGSTPAAAREAYDPSDFAPSIEHAQAHQAVLNRQAQNKRLQSDKELEEAEATKKQSLAGIKTVMIRVRFPDQMMVDLPMTSEDTVAGLYTTVKDMLDAPSQPFELKYTGSKRSLETLDANSTKKLISDLGMVGRVLVTMVWHSSVDTTARQRPVLKEALRGQATKLEVQVPQVQEEVVSKPASSEQKEPPKKKSTASKADIEARMKKMLGFGKK